LRTGGRRGATGLRRRCASRACGAALPRVPHSIETKTLKIVVMGHVVHAARRERRTLAYPARLEVALQKKLPGVNVKVISLPSRARRRPTWLRDSRRS
jgi:hypothetical protein